MSRNQLLLFVFAGIAIAGVVWYSFLRDRGDTTLIQTTDFTEAGMADRDVVNTLLQLREVSLSGTIFQDPAFVSLQDFGRQIVPEPVGRQNPFAPLGAVVATSSGTTTRPR